MIHWKIDEDGEKYLPTKKDKFTRIEDFKRIFGEEEKFDDLKESIDDEYWKTVLDKWGEKEWIDND